MRRMFPKFVFPNVVVISNADHIVEDGDDVVCLIDINAARTVTLPANPEVGRTVIVKVSDGSATNINTVTVIGNGHNIDGAATRVFGTPVRAFPGAMLTFTGTFWSIVSETT